MSKLQDITSGPVRDLMSGAVFTKGVLAINAASAATVKTTNAIVFSVNGVMYSKAVLSAQSIAVTHNSFGNAGGSFVQPAGTTVFYTLGLDASGTVSVTQGSFAGQDLSTLNGGTSARGSGLIPDSPAGATPFGVIKVVTNASTTFTPGTTALDAAGLTVSYFDINSLPQSL